MRKGAVSDDISTDNEIIDSLREAAHLIVASINVLKKNRTNYQATNLPVSDAVDHVVSCLIKDSEYLERLAEICEEAEPALRKFEK